MKRTTKRTRALKQAKHEARRSNALRRHNARAKYLRDRQAAFEARQEVAALITS